MGTLTSSLIRTECENVTCSCSQLVQNSTNGEASKHTSYVIYNKLQYQYMNPVYCLHTISSMRHNKHATPTFPCTHNRAIILLYPEPTMLSYRECSLKVYCTNSFNFVRNPSVSLPDVYMYTAQNVSFWKDDSVKWHSETVKTPDTDNYLSFHQLHTRSYSLSSGCLKCITHMNSEAFFLSLE